MTRSILKQEAKKQLSRNLGTLILSGLLLGVIMNIPSVIQSIGISTAMFDFKLIPNSGSKWDILVKIFTNPSFIAYNTISSWVGIVVFLLAPVLTLGVHHVYLKAAKNENPHFSEMFSKMSQFGTAFVTNLLIGIFVFLWSLLLIIPGIIASYSYSMAYFVLAEHPELSALEAIKESKRIMKGHKWELFVLQLSFFWWYLLCIPTLGLAMVYVIPYIEMAKANFYNRVKQEEQCC